MDASERDLLRLLTAGSVDDGKSTLIGRLLHDSRSLTTDHLHAASEAGKSRGLAIDFASLVDGLRDEREQGITIDVAYRYFATARRSFILADCPGHEQYTRNMVTGASTANLGIVLVDAEQGVRTQTRRHAFLCSLLGIRHLVIAVNKMDLVGFSEQRFLELKAELTQFVAKLEVADVHFVPIAALSGDNVVATSTEMPWYHGGPLLDYLETVHIASDRNYIDFRFPVQSVVRSGSFRGFAGSIASGSVQLGDEVVALPSNEEARIKSIVTYDGELNSASAGQAVTLTLDRELDVARSVMLAKSQNRPVSSTEFESMVVWLSRDPLDDTRRYLFKLGTQKVAGTLEQLRYRLDVNTLHRTEASTLELNEFGRALCRTISPVQIDPYRRNRRTGCFIVIDRDTHETVAGGIVLETRSAGRQPQRDASEDASVWCSSATIELLGQDASELREWLKARGVTLAVRGRSREGGDVN